MVCPLWHWHRFHTIFILAPFYITSISFISIIIIFFRMRPFTAYCALFSLVGIVLNCLFLLVTRLQRVERVQEVLIFLRSIAVGYIFVAITLMAVAPQSITLASTNIRIPHGLLSLSNAGLSSNFMNGLAAFGVGAFLFTAISFCLLFLYHYRKTAGQMSTVFAPKNVPVFLGVAVVFCLVQAFLLFYSKVDPNYLIERLSRSKKWEEVQLSLGMNPNASFSLADSLIQQQNGAGGGTNGGGGGGNGGGQSNNGGGASGSLSGGFQSITGGSNYSALAAAIESRQYEKGGVMMIGGGGGGASPETRLFEGSFGTDYTRNPLYFLANSVLMLALVIAWTITELTAITVKCKLSGRQESMSDKSHQEMQTFTNVLILAHFHTLLVACAGINYIVCFVMGETSKPVQEYLGMLLLAPVPALYPLTCLLFLKEFRMAACQILLCSIWTRKQRQQRAAAESKARDNIDDELASAARNKARNKRMPNSDIALGGGGGGGENTGANAAKSASSIGGGGGGGCGHPISNGGSSSQPENRPGRYADATDGAHREARALFGKQ